MQNVSMIFMDKFRILHPANACKHLITDIVFILENSTSPMQNAFLTAWFKDI